MPPVLSKVKNRKLHGQTREVVANVFKFMKDEASRQDFTFPVQKVQVRTAAATGVSERLVRDIKKELEQIERGDCSAFTTPDKSRRRLKTIIHLDDFDKCAVRRTVHNFYVTEKCAPTINKLKAKLQESIDFKGGSTSLGKILKELGFKWARTKNNRKVLIEKTDIRNKRITYLTNLKHYREEGHPIIFLDESYILTSHVSSKGWTDDSKEGLLAPINKGQRLIIVHAGGSEGFVPNAELIWKASKSTGDYHDNMNQSNYMKWAETKLIPNLKPNSVVVIDNAPYHNVQTDKAPTSNTIKEDMIKWLIDHNIPFSPTMLKPQLYRLIALHKPLEKKYIFDELMKQHGHIVLRLPPYHPDLNPIELIWAQLKNWVAQHNTTFKIEDVFKLCEQQLKAIGKNEWSKVCSHVENLEKEYLEKEGFLDTEIDRIIINLGGEDSDSDNDLERSVSQDEEEDSDDELTGIQQIA